MRDQLKKPEKQAELLKTGWPCRSLAACYPVSWQSLVPNVNQIDEKSEYQYMLQGQASTWCGMVLFQKLISDQSQVIIVLVLMWISTRGEYMSMTHGMLSSKYDQCSIWWSGQGSQTARMAKVRAVMLTPDLFRTAFFIFSELLVVRFIQSVKSVQQLS